MVSARLRAITLAGMFVGLVFVSKLYLSFTTPQFRMSFHDVPIFIAGMLLGPFFGAVVAFAADIIFWLQSGFSFSFLLNLADVFIGSMAGWFLYVKRHPIHPVRISLVVVVSTLVAFALSTAQQYLWFNTGMFALLPWRFFVTVVKWPITILVLLTVLPRITPILYSEDH